MIFSKDIEPICLYCLHSSPSIDDATLICKKKGIVTCDYTCKKYEYDPTKRIPKRLTSISRPKYDATDFKF